MICNICGMNQATVHLTEIVNSQMIEVHICENCAQEKGTEFKTHFNVGDLFAGLSEMGITEKVTSRDAKARCVDCGLVYDDFAKTGRLGCPRCYETFAKFLMPLIKKVQRSSHHLGKKPLNISQDVRSSHDLRLLQERLRKCIQLEEFEEAAQLRDKIKDAMEKDKQKRKAKRESNR